MKRSLLIVFVISLIASPGLLFAQNVGVGATSPQSRLEVGGSFGTAIQTVTGATTLDATYSTVLATPSSAYTITLPAVATSTRRIYTIVYNGTAGGNIITIKGNLSENISNNATIANTYTLTGGSITLQSNGTSWFVSASVTTDWTTKGNAGITQPATPTTYGTTTIGTNENFLGNIDAKDLVIGTSNLERMRILANGKIGIGTAAPVDPLHIFSSFSNRVTIQSGSNNYAGYLSRNDSINYFAGINTGTNRYTIFDNTHNSERFSMLSNGYLGLNNIAPAYQLDVSGDIRAGSAFRTTASNGNILQVGDDAWISDVNAADMIGILGQGTSTNGGIRFGGGGAYLFSNNTTRIGINTTSPAGPLDVYGSDAGLSRYYLRNTNTTAGARADVNLVATGSGGPRNLYIGVDDGRTGLNTYTGNGGAYFDNETSGPLFFQNSSGKNIVGMPIPAAGNNGTALTLTNVANTQTLSISPGYFQGTANAAATTLDMGGTQLLYVWDNFAASGSITASSSTAPSDERIKNVIGISNAEKDLKTLNAINITDYIYKDTALNGNKIYKKVIAQEVQSVYPTAVVVQALTQYIPNIYVHTDHFQMKDSTVTITLNDELKPAKDIKVGSHLKVFVYAKADGKETEVKGTITGLDSRALTVETTTHMDRDNYKPDMLVYGTQIDDLLTVDYDAIAMLNVSATQELARLLAATQKENAQLKLELAEIKEQSKNTKSDMDKLKASVENIQSMMGVKVP